MTKGYLYIQRNAVIDFQKKKPTNSLRLHFLQ